MSRRTGLPGAQRGASLVEALVALVVMSVGMLGIASLYVTSLKTNRSALTRTQAVTLVNDMADRIRANPVGRGAYDRSSYPAQIPETDCSGATNCSPEDLAKSDLQTWLASFNGVLPGNAAGDVDFVSGGGVLPDTYSISISWREPGEPAPYRYALNIKLVPVKP